MDKEKKKPFNTLNINRDVLYNLYIEQNLTIPNISKKLECGKTSIIRYLKKYNIKKPKDLKDILIKNSKYHTVKYDREYIIDQYINKNRLAKDISNELGCSVNYIRGLLSDRHLTKTQESKTQNTIRFKIDKEHLNSLYINQNMSAQDIANKNEISTSTVYRNCHLLGIKKPKKLQTELAVKSFIKSGKMNIIDNKSVLFLSEEYGLGINTINKFLRDNPNLTDKEILEYLPQWKHNTATSLEKKINLSIDLSFFNRKPIENINYKPDFKIGENTYLNVDGLYWHCEVHKDKHHHFIMRQEYEKYGLRLLQFREDEVNEKIDIIKSIINNIKGLSTKIYARNTEIKVVNQKEANFFLNKNHIMGLMKAKHMGLFYENKLILLASYKMHGNVLKIERFCSELNHTIIGGFSKILNHLEKTLKPKQIHYWVDLRYGTGKHLLEKGFIFSHETLGWKWTDLHKTYNRRLCRANMDNRKLKEREYSNELGWYKIYDAGQRLYVKDLVNV